MKPLPPQGPKLVILRRASSVYEAARAMADNHVGAVLVVDRGRLAGIVTDRDVALAVARDDFDPHHTPLAAVMSDVVGACAEGAGVADVLTTMRQYACRRVPITRAQKPVGLVTLDDLVLDGRASLDDLRDVVAAQLERPSRLKPEGAVRPVSVRPPGEGEPLSAVEAAYRTLLHQIEDRAGLPSRDHAEAALGVVLDALCRRLPPDDARRLLSGIPRWARAALAPDPEAPDDSVSIDTVAEALRAELDLLPDAATDILLCVVEWIRARPGEDAALVRARLPAVLQEMFPRTRRVSG
jgi:CBS domain-containing protein